MTDPASPLLPVSATLICRNEEALIGKCLASLADLAEIVVVDSGSTDATLRIVEDFRARGFPIRLFERDWPGYAAQKQFALDQATQPWVLSIDADEWLDDDLRAALPELLRAEGGVAGWRLRRMLTFFGRTAPVSRWTRSETILRLVRRAGARFDLSALVHEGLIVDGRTPKAPRGILRHERALPLDEQMRKEILYARLKAEQRVRQGRAPSLVKLVFNPPWYFLRLYVGNRLFLCGADGFAHALTGAAYAFMAETLHRQLWRTRRAAARPPSAGLP